MWGLQLAGMMHCGPPDMWERIKQLSLFNQLTDN